MSKCENEKIKITLYITKRSSRRAFFCSQRSKVKMALLAVNAQGKKMKMSLCRYQEDDGMTV